MTLGEKLAKLRKNNNYTQEQLADLLGISRQSTSKWESDIAYPETDKLILLGKLYGCSMDYLLKEEETRETPTGSDRMILHSFCRELRSFYFERKSKKTVCGLPLWHINIGLGRTAKGIFAVGAIAIGQFSAGALAIGNYLAIGDEARAAIAIGKSKAYGSVYEAPAVTAENRAEIFALLDEIVPKIFTWCKELIKHLL